MPVYEFSNLKPIAPVEIPGTQAIIHPVAPEGVRQSSDIEGGKKGPDITPSDHPDEIQEFLIPGFNALDGAMKKYWAGLRVPTKDAYRFMQVKIAGGDKSVLSWKKDNSSARIPLPVCSINRLSYEFNAQKYSPAYFSIDKRFTGPRMDRIAKVRRPVPFLVDYEMIIWAEHKRDAEYILFQIATRFNPLITFNMSDDHIQGCVTLLSNGHTDASDKEVNFDQNAKIRYEYRMTAEAWLPIPNIIVPTVLGKVTTYKEQVKDLLATTVGTIITN